MVWFVGSGMFQEKERCLMNNYLIELCPYCGAINYINNGNTEDLTVSDVEAIKCWKCKHAWLLEGVGEWTTLNDAHTVEGHPIL